MLGLCKQPYGRLCVDRPKFGRTVHRLKDKNGKKIYEGDILADLKGCIIGAVQGGVRGYCYDVVYPRPIKGETDWPLYGIVVNDYGGKVVVAGNIYENPELMKGGK